MKDKPVAAKILLSLANVKDYGEEFIALSGTLYNQNLIYSEPRELRIADGILELTVTFRDINSFNTWTKSPKVIEYWSKKFKSLLLSEPKTIQEYNVILEVDNVAICTCGKSGFYILEGRSHQFTDELICNNCLGQITYSRIPESIEIENWQRHHERVYLNWLETSFFEKEALMELTNYKEGKLNVEGEKIRKQLTEYFGIPVYRSLFVEHPDENTLCLICGTQGINSGLKSPSCICKDCNTVFNYTEK